MDIPVIPQKEIFVIGDIHGCADELTALLDKLPLRPDTAVVFVGDYIDRGPASRRVIDTVLDLGKRVPVYPLMGNHEALLLDFMEEPSPLNSARFIYNGGGATLQSYCEKPGDYDFPETHVAFLLSLKLAYQTDSYVFVHAGLPDLPLNEIHEQAHRETLLWIRGPFHRSSFRWGKTVVHGHSRVPRVEIKPQRINVDTGCVYDNLLSAIHLPSRQVFSVAKRGAVEHTFLREPPESKRRAVRFEGQVDVTLTEPKGLPVFATLNYNDFGLLLVSVRTPDVQVLSVGQEIAGVIFPNDRYVHVQFRGTVVRIEKDGSVYRYGVRFHTPAVQPP